MGTKSQRDGNRRRSPVAAKTVRTDLLDERRNVWNVFRRHFVQRKISKILIYWRRVLLDSPKEEKSNKITTCDCDHEI